MNKLQNAVVKQLGYDSLCDEALQTLSDVANHGAAGGYGSFVYYSDTVEFYNDNKEAIDRLLIENAHELGETASELVSSFGCLDLEVFEVESFFMGYGNDDDEAYIKNALAWFALEDTAYKLTEQ